MIDTALQQIIDRAAQLSPEEQQALVARLLQVLNTFLDEKQEELEELAWERRLSTPSSQHEALKAVIAEGRQQYEAGETEEIVGDTFA